MAELLGVDAAALGLPPLGLLAVFLAGFALGGVPFGLLVARAFGAADPRTVGSGNIGATNVLRTGSKGAAVATLLLDMLKGAAPVWIADAVFGAAPAALAGLGAFLGHCYSPYLGFKGGKGVATGFGAILGWSGLIALATALGWIAAVVLTRRSSVGAFAATAVALAGFALLERPLFFWATVPMAAVLIWRHRANIQRLLRGEEPPISLGGGSKPKSAEAEQP